MFFSFFQGRATAFAIVFTVVGVIGFFKKYDLTSYAAFVAAIFTGVVGHSLKEDYFEDRRAQRAQQNSQPPQAPIPPAASNESGTNNEEVSILGPISDFRNRSLSLAPSSPRRDSPNMSMTPPMRSTPRASTVALWNRNLFAL